MSTQLGESDNQPKPTPWQRFCAFLGTDEDYFRLRPRASDADQGHMVDEIPHLVREVMLGGVAGSSAHHTVCVEKLERGKVWHPGDPIGRVIVWLWRADRRSHAASMLGDYVAQVREHNPNAPDPRPAFSDLIKALPYALPGATDQEAAEIVEYMRVEVPRYFGASIEAP